MAGRVYIPLDDETPSVRRDAICDDAGVSLILADSPLDGPWTACAAVGTLTLWRRPAPVTLPPLPEDVAYIVFTSGSTGVPKGCLVRETGLSEMLGAIAGHIGASDDDRWSCLHSFSFDVSVYEMWAPLVLGATVSVLSEDARRDPASLLEELGSARTTIVSLTPSLLSILLTELAIERVELPDVRHVLLAGEAIRLPDIARLFSSGVMPHARVWNLWGISEGTVHCTIREITPGVLSADWSHGTPIGRPLPHLEVTLRDLDPASEDDPGAGEMVVQGSGVAWGYLNRPELTDETFELEPGSGLARYRSGDWARLVDGELLYVGRRDNQVKIRGFRVELEEVEAALTHVESVRAAACVALRLQNREDVVLGCVIEAPRDVDQAGIRRSLQQRLPSFMVPERMLVVDEMPLTPNGKSDRSRVARLLGAAEAGES